LSRYNYEPLNFFRGAMSMICCTFAVFEILIFRNIFDDEAQALADWVRISGICVVFYIVCMCVRWRAFVKSSEQKQVEEKVAEIRGDQKKARKDVRQQALEHELGRTRTLHVAMQQP
jgi:hypothetical protein